MSTQTLQRNDPVLIEEKLAEGWSLREICRSGIASERFLKTRFKGRGWSYVQAGEFTQATRKGGGL